MAEAQLGTDSLHRATHKCQVKTTLCTIKHRSTFVVMRTRIA